MNSSPVGIFSEFFGLFFGHSKGPPARRVPPVCPNCEVQLDRVGGGKGCHRCRRCAGLWVTEEFLAVAVQAEESQIQAILVGQTGAHTFSRSPQMRDCPGCTHPMENYAFGYQSGIWVDGCSDGHGIWLDPGELVLIRAYQERQRGPMSAEERAKMAAAFLDGASTSRRNILDAMPKRDCGWDFGSDGYSGDNY